jgi:hypothetical protein
MFGVRILFNKQWKLNEPIIIGFILIIINQLQAHFQLKDSQVEWPITIQSICIVWIVEESFQLIDLSFAYFHHHPLKLPG